MTSTMAPAMKANIPIRIKSTFQPDDPGTVVANSAEPSQFAIRGVTTLGNVALLNIAGKALKTVSDIAGRLLISLAKASIQVTPPSSADRHQQTCRQCLPPQT